MTMYFTKVWRFDVPVGPLQFGTRGWRDRSRQMLKTGDLVVLAGTKGEPTADADRGRLLGVMEPTTEPVLSLDFDLFVAPHDSNEHGDYKWPYGLLNRRAWKLIDRPLLQQISNRHFSMEAAQGIVALTDTEAAEVSKLRREEVPVLEPGVRARARLEGLDAALKRTAPVPTTTRRGVMHMRNWRAYTYAMQLIGARQSSFKIGWAFDRNARTREFNQAAMPALGGLCYKPVLDQLWDTARKAYRMEQRLLRSFENKRHSANREIVWGVEYSELEAAWIKFVALENNYGR
jgi:hypothetical protein